MKKYAWLGWGVGLSALTIAGFGWAAPGLLAGPKATPEQAEALFKARDWKGAAAAYQAIVRAEPENGTAWFHLGLSAHELGELDRAVKAYERSVQHGFQPAGRAMFHAARASAAMGRKTAAFSWLDRLVAAGIKPYAALQNQPEFDALKGDPRYAELLAKTKPCNTDAHRQFDFWVGDWDVVSANTSGKPSHNRIRSLHGGCVLLEEYDTPTGYTGVSLSFYDPNKKKWHQTWIDNQGNPIYHEGTVEDGKMVLIDDPNGDPINRTTWTPLPDHKVRQHWETSTDGGKTWRTTFDGIYSRRAE